MKTLPWHEDRDISREEAVDLYITNDKLKHIIKILLDNEANLSDGFDFYIPSIFTEDDERHPTERDEQLYPDHWDWLPFFKYLAEEILKVCSLAV